MKQMPKASHLYATFVTSLDFRGGIIGGTAKEASFSDTWLLAAVHF